MKKLKSVFMANSPSSIDYVYRQDRLDQLKEICDLYPVVISQENFHEHLDYLKEVEAIFSTWSFWSFSEEEFAAMPNLKHVFYGAGATDNFARPLFAHNVALYSAWQANAIPVAEYTLGHILLACKGFYNNSRNYTTPENKRKNIGPGIFDETIVLIGDGAISKYLQKLLKNFNLKVIEIPSKPELRTISLEEAFKLGIVVSNHLPNRSDNQKVIKEEHFSSMRNGATFINTGRGAQVDEAALIKVMQNRKDLTAILDVTDPEPPEENSPFYTLDNIILSGHIAGSMNNEVVRMADFMIEEYKRVVSGEKPQYQVFEEMLMTH
jgi:phosphoglycerate dehydrogenase-like enzyme